MYALMSDAERQQGYTVLGLILAVAITGVIATQFTERLEYELITQAETATVNDITQLAQAQLNYRWENRVWVPTPDDPLLFNSFRNVNGVGEPYDFGPPPGPAPDSPLIIKTNLRTSGSALRVAQRLGSFADVFPDPDSGEMTWLRAEYAVPLYPLDTLDKEYVRRDGSNDMLGTLAFRNEAGITADIDMNGNKIEDASRVTARTASGDGLVNADLGAIDTLTVNNFRYVITP